MALIPFRPIGANNVDPPESVGRPDPNSRSLTYTEGTEMVNVDMYEQGGGRRRRGVVLDMAGIDPHSGWSNGAMAFFIEGGALKRFWPGAGGEILALLSTDNHGAFCQVNDITVFSNGEDFHVIEAGRVATPFMPSDPFKTRMSPGTCLEFYNGRLYAALGRVLYNSDSLDTPGGVEQMDERQNITAVFASEIRMVKRVAGGLFVSDGQETFFFAGKDPVLDEGFEQRSVLPYPAIPGATAIAITASQLGSTDVQGEACIWTSERGVCIGLPGGTVINVSDGRFATPAGRHGTAIVREQNGQVHYLCVIRDPRSGYNPHDNRSLFVSSHPIAE